MGFLDAFLGRTKVGDIVQLYVLHERRQLIAADPATVPSGQGFSIVLTDWEPRVAFPVELKLPWDRGFGVDLGTTYTAAAVYRGWMVTPAQYRLLYDALAARLHREL